MATTKRGRAVNASGATTLSARGESHGRCEVCHKPFASYRSHQRLCSARCRLLLWATRRLVDDYNAGRLPGLEAEIARLK